MGRTSIVADTNFHELPRRRLQQLCKKHGVPANKTNAAMADALTDIYRNGNLPPPSPYTATPRPRRTRTSEPGMLECEESEYSDSQLGSQLATPSGSVCMGSYGVRLNREHDDCVSPGAKAFPRQTQVVSEEEEDSASSTLRASCNRIVESTLVVTLPTIEEKGECLEALVTVEALVTIEDQQGRQPAAEPELSEQVEVVTLPTIKENGECPGALATIEDQQVQQPAAEPQLFEQVEEEKQNGLQDSAHVFADVAANTIFDLGAADDISKTSVHLDDVSNQEQDKKELDQELYQGALNKEQIENIPSLESLASAFEDPVAPLNLEETSIVEVYEMDGDEVIKEGEHENVQTPEGTSHSLQERDLAVREAPFLDTVDDSPMDARFPDNHSEARTAETLQQETMQGCWTEAMVEGVEDHQLLSEDRQTQPSTEAYLCAPSTKDCPIVVDNSSHNLDLPGQDVSESDLQDGTCSPDVLQDQESVLVTVESFVAEGMDVDLPTEDLRTKVESAEHNLSLIIESRHEECLIQRKNLYKKTPFVGEQSPSLRALKRALKEKQAQRDGLINKKRSAVSSTDQQPREFGTPLRINGDSVSSIAGNGSDEVQRKEALRFDSPFVPPVPVYIDGSPDCVEESDAVTDQVAEDTKPVSVAAVSRESARLVGQKHKPGKHVPTFYGRRQWMEKAMANAAQKRLEDKEKVLSVAPTGHLIQDKENIKGPAGGRTAEMLKKHQEGYKAPLTGKFKEKARQVSKKLAQSRRKLVLNERRGLPIPAMDSPPAESAVESMLPESTTPLIQ